MKPSILSVLLAGALLIAMTAVVLAHGGGLDSSGGHHDRKHGGYHFHRGPLAGQHFASKAAAPATLYPSSSQLGASQQSLSSTPEGRSVEERLEALTRLLVRKGIITEAELAKELQARQ